MSASLAVAWVVLRVCKLRTVEDIERLRAQIEEERDRWAEVVRARTEQLEQLEAFETLLGSSPEGER